MRKDPEGTQPPPEGPKTKEEKELDDFTKRANKDNPDGAPGGR